MPLRILRFGSHLGSADAWAYLEESGCQIEWVPSEGAGFRLPDQGATDCCVLDCTQPPAALMRLCGELARRPDHEPILVLLDAGEISLAVELMRVGAGDVLARPVTGEELAAHVQGALYERQLAGEVVPHQARLTYEECEVAVLALAGLSNEEIARRLTITCGTAEEHRRSAVLKIRPTADHAPRDVILERDAG